MTDAPTVKGLTFKVNHTMLPVADLERSIDFYTRLLGMTVRDQHASEARKNKVGLVGYGEGTREPSLELTQDTSESAPSQVTPANIHIGIDVSDLHALCSILEIEGVTFIRPLKARGDGKGWGAWVEDPDRHPLELAERYS